MAENVIEVCNVTKRFGTSEVLKNVSINFEKGKIHGLIGRNGSGKTMLMKCICGFVPVSEGKILVDNKEIGKDIDVPESIGAIIETPGFLYGYSGYNNLKFLASIRNKISKEKIRQTNLERYGATSPFGSPKIQEKIKRTNLERYGYSCVLMNPEIQKLQKKYQGKKDQTSMMK